MGEIWNKLSSWGTFCLIFCTVHVKAGFIPGRFNKTSSERYSKSTLILEYHDVLGALHKGLPEVDLPQVGKVGEFKRVGKQRKLTFLGQERYRLQLDDEKELEHTLRVLRKMPYIKSAHREGYFRVAQSISPNDPIFQSGQQYNLIQSEFPKAWPKTVGDQSVIVAVIDSGVENGHPDLFRNIHSTFNFKTNTVDVQDDQFQGHGTHVAGIIGATGNNFVGVSGTNWNTSLMILKVTDRDGFAFSTDIARAIRFAVDQGADIINISLVSVDNRPDSLIESAVAYAESKDVLIVAAAGNESDDQAWFPSAYDYENMISVGSLNSIDNRSHFSNYGPTVDIFAYGENIFSTLPFGVLPSGYGSLSGTSMATPQVAGLAALIQSYFNFQPSNQEKTYQKIKRKLLFGASELKSLKGQALFPGKINADQSLSGLLIEPYNPLLGVGATASLKAQLLPTSNILQWDVDQSSPSATQVDVVENQYSQINKISGQLEIKDSLNGSLVEMTYVQVTDGLSLGHKEVTLIDISNIKESLESQNLAGFSLSTPLLIAGDTSFLSSSALSNNPSLESFEEIIVDYGDLSAFVHIPAKIDLDLVSEKRFVLGGLEREIGLPSGFGPRDTPVISLGPIGQKTHWPFKVTIELASDWLQKHNISDPAAELSVYIFNPEFQSWEEKKLRGLGNSVSFRTYFQTFYRIGFNSQSSRPAQDNGGGGGGGCGSLDTGGRSNGSSGQFILAVLFGMFLSLGMKIKFNLGKILVR